MLKHAFEGKLTTEWRQQNIDKPVPAPQPDQEWEQTTLGKVASWGSGGTPSRSHPEYFRGFIPWLKTGELGTKHIRKSEETISETALKESSAKIFSQGSVVIAMYGATIGKTSILGINAATNQACAVAQIDAHILSNTFLYYFLLSINKKLIEAGQGGAQPNISQGILKSWPISLPPLSEQKQIVAEVESRLSVADQLETDIEEVLQKVANFRQSILKKAFSGQLVTQDPHDEPVSILLGQIRGEKEKAAKSNHSKKTKKKKATA